MKKQILLGLFAMGLAMSAKATTFADADYFGTQSGGPNGNPSGTTLTFGGTASTSGQSFDFVNADGTASFTIAAPYSTGLGTYTSQLGFLVGSQHVVDGYVTLFMRDPAGGSETLVYTSELASQSITHGSFTTQLVISENITAEVAGIIDANGKIAYTVTATSGSFVLDAAYMNITVPDGGSTVALLGGAVLALGIFRRKVKALLS